MKKQAAADRTIGMFSAPGKVDEAKSLAEAEVLAPEEKGERVPIEEDVDRLRDVAFKGLEWTSRYFGSPESNGSTFRVTHKAGNYLLESVLKEPGRATAYGYTGVFIKEADLLEVTKVLVAAVRELQARTKV